MTTISAKHEGGDRFSISIRGHTVMVDQPQDHGGDDSAPTPTELFVAGLVGCQGCFARRFLAPHGLTDQELDLEARFEMAPSAPSRVTAIVTEIRLRRELAPEIEAGLRRSVERCTVHNSIVQAPDIEVRFTTAPVPG